MMKQLIGCDWAGGENIENQQSKTCNRDDTSGYDTDPAYGINWRVQSNNQCCPEWAVLFQ